MEEFPSASFYQIQLDVPRLVLEVEGTMAAAYRLFNNYTKRNSIANYVQSHGCIGAKIINLVHKADIKIQDIH
jgi:hypothetical protein